MFPGALLQLKGSKGYRVIFHLFDLFQVIFQPFGFGFEMFFFTRPKAGSSLHVISLAVGHPHPLLADS